MTAPRPFVPAAQAERVIGVARLTLTISSMLAYWIDPSEPTKYAGFTRALTTGYAAWAVAVLLMSRSRVFTRRWQVSTHAVDLVVCLLVTNLTERTDSPYFLYLVFALMAATLRWDAAGALWTGGAALAVFVGTVVVELMGRGPVEWRVFIIRGTYLVVLALMLAYLGQYAAQVRATTQKLRTWQPPTGDGVASIMAEAVRYAADIIGAPRAMAVWEDPEEPLFRLTSWADGRASTSQMDGATFQPLVPLAFESTDFFCDDAARAESTVVFTTGSGLATAPGPAVDRGFVDQYAIRTVLAVRCGTGRLFVTDKEPMTVDDLWLAQIVAQQVAGTLHQALLLQRLEETRAVEARARVARDLHDGVLQSLTAITLRLQTLARRVDAEARLGIERLQTMIGEEARRLRRFIQDLTSPVLEVPAEALGDRLEALGRQVEQDWGLRVEITTVGVERLPNGIGHDLYFLAREALVNVARHAGASTARVSMAVDGGRLVMTVDDDGHGFAFQGRRDGRVLAAAGLAPRMLYERVTALGGSLAVQSAGNGSRVDIELPVADGKPR